MKNVSIRVGHFIGGINEKEFLFLISFIKGADVAAWISGGNGRKNFRGTHAARCLRVHSLCVLILCLESGCKKRYRRFKIPEALCLTSCYLGWVLACMLMFSDISTFLWFI